MTLELGRDVTPAEAYSSLGTDGINQAVANRQATMTLELGGEVTTAEAHSSLSQDAGNRRVELAGTMRLDGTTRATLSETGMMGRCELLIDDGREFVQPLGVSMWRQEPI